MDRPAREQKEARDLPRPSLAYVQHVLIAAAVLAGLFLTWQIRAALLVVLAGVIVAVLLAAAAQPIRRYTPLPHGSAVGIAALVIVAATGLVSLLVGSQVNEQISALSQRLPEAASQLEQRLGLSLEGAGKGAGEGRGGSLGEVQSFVGRIASFGYKMAETLTGTILVVIAGVFLAMDPDTYKRGIVQLFPKRAHKQIETTLEDCGVALHRYLVGLLVSMLIVGLLAGFGVWALGLPAPLALGLFAGLTQFVPVIGPIVGAVPALILAAGEGGYMILWTALLFLAIQQLESNMITPLIQRRAVNLPPGVFLLSIFAFGILFGTLGVIVAGPLTVVAFVAVKKLYVRDTLGGETDMPGGGGESSP
ncbi:MAG: AI-2E family transporter [Alphaproteobacteria bacterium]|nr:AI-2E family transporter [Alphaproteobacteria bacterium]